MGVLIDNLSKSDGLFLIKYDCLFAPVLSAAWNKIFCNSLLLCWIACIYFLLVICCNRDLVMVFCPATVWFKTEGSGYSVWFLTDPLSSSWIKVKDFSVSLSNCCTKGLLVTEILKRIWIKAVGLFCSVGFMVFEMLLFSQGIVFDGWILAMAESQIVDGELNAVRVIICSLLLLACCKRGFYRLSLLDGYWINQWVQSADWDMVYCIYFPLRICCKRGFLNALLLSAVWIKAGGCSYSVCYWFENKIKKIDITYPAAVWNKMNYYSKVLQLDKDQFYFLILCCMDGKLLVGWADCYSLLLMTLGLLGA